MDVHFVRQNLLTDTNEKGKQSNEAVEARRRFLIISTLLIL